MKELQPFEISFSGINLIEASAGTGKTYNITSLYIRALIEQEIPVSKILVVTYTEAATKELKDRLLQRMREAVSVLKNGEVANKQDQFLHELLHHTDERDHAIEQLEKAIRSFDESAVYTIHGFCYQALQEQAFESRAMYDAELIGDDSELVLEAVDDYWRNWVAEVSEHPNKQPLFNLLLDNGYEPEKLAKELGPHLGKPYLKVLPENIPSVSEIEGTLQELHAIFKKLQDSWLSNREEILSLLLSDSLNGRKYRKDYLASWFEYMDDFLSSEFVTIKPFDQFANFSRSMLEENLNKGYDEIPSHPFFDLTEEYLSMLDSVLGFETTFKKNLIEYLWDELEQKKEDLQVLSYDDLLLRLRNALVDGDHGDILSDKLREKYPIAMVDEFQDTDPSQYEIFSRIFADQPESALFMIGDPKQSIYSFRGADVFSYLKAKRDAPGENTYDLGRNFRSVPKLLEGFNTLFGEHDNPFILDRISYDTVEPGMDADHYNELLEHGESHPPIRFRNIALGERDQFNKKEAAELAAEDTAQEIYRLIEEGKVEEAIIGEKKVEAKDIAVLVRTHKQAALMSEVLREKGIKSVQYSQESVFESEEAHQLEIFLKAVTEPTNENLITTALAMPLVSYSANDLIDLKEDEEQWVSILDQFAEWHRIWQEKGFSPMFRSVIKEANISEHLIGYPVGERKVTNLLHLGELMQAEAQQQKEGMRSLVKWLARKRKEESGDRDEEQLRLESDQELVKIVTMHRSKGLEYPIVFCPFLWYGPRYQDQGKPLVYHDPHDFERTYLDLNGKFDSDRNEKRLLVAREELAESLRLAYVAMTRAEHCCYLSWAYAKRSEFSPLGHLLSDPEKCDDLLKETIEQSYNAVGYQQFESEIKRLCEDYPSLFTMDTPPLTESLNKQSDLFDTKNDLQLSVRRFDRVTPITTSYEVSSFSSLSSWMEEDDPDVPDYDQFTDYGELEEPATDQPEKKTMFTFPKGPQPGTCIHNIFENYFSNSEDKHEVITNQLQLNGIDLEWENTVSEMLDLVLHKSLHQDIKGLSLSVVKDSQIPEMEFYYQNEEIETRNLLSIIRNGAAPHWENKGRAASGFLKGFIDLTFEFDGKYYLLDYKTNYLGDTITDYHQDELQKEMREASYDLQYHIYTVALHRFLKKRVPGYSYNKHFGGAFYLFLRGMNKEDSEGIFFDRPDEQVIITLNEYIKGGSDG
ncbi:exodeoxyribonuclease V subunit beta [Fodinibius sp. AD559]|uniref:exodeoxyribonuclease V subunit beta n=1 Tax=Fodinibius sp. AD559 TaxID=3424179 RepID=UPI004046915D